MGKEHLIAEFVVKTSLDDAVDEVLALFNEDDGRSFEEKKKDAIDIINKSGNSQFAEPLASAAVADAVGLQNRTRFWRLRQVNCSARNIILREIKDSDREMYLEIQRDYNALKSMLAEEVYCDMIWKEHTGDKALMLAIEMDGKYIGYCGINNTTQKPWEIAIELHRNWTGQGIGRIAVSAMLDAIRNRLDVTDFRIRIEASNTASRKLFERLGAVPNGISRYLIDNEAQLEKLEEENLHLIDDEAVAVAKQFGVEPRKLLSHCLEYTLAWK